MRDGVAQTLKVLLVLQRQAVNTVTSEAGLGLLMLAAVLPAEPAVLLARLPSLLAAATS